MKSWLFNLVYLAAYLVMLPIILWRRVRAGRSLGNPAQRIFGRVPRSSGDAPVVWFHAVSVGEVNQLQTLLDRLKQQKPDWQIVVSTTTATGMQLARQKFPQLTTFWFPIDFSWAVRAALRRVRPALLVLTELELWPNLIDMASRQRIPLTVINGRLGEKSFHGYRRFSWLTQPMFTKLNLVVTQDSQNARRFVDLGTPATRVQVAGSLKFDNAWQQAARWQSAELLQPVRQLYALPDRQWLLVAGSTQAPEESMIGTVYQQLVTRYPKLRLVVVPRHPHRADEVARQLAGSGLTVVRRTSGQQIGVPESAPAPVLLVDTIGELGLWWSLAGLAFVGGSFGSRGGQNMLEPAAAGCATCFGPNTWNFAQIVADMQTAGAGREVPDMSGLSEFIERCLADSGGADRLGQTAREFVDRHQGATDRTIGLLASAVANTPRRSAVPRRAA